MSKKDAAIWHIKLFFGKYELTEQESEFMEEALIIGNLDLWEEKTYTKEEWFNKREFEIKAISYFGQKTCRAINDIEGFTFFRKKEDRERNELKELKLKNDFNGYDI